MLQALLIQRFHLVVHRETVPGRVYLLEKSGKPILLQPRKLPSSTDSGDTGAPGSTAGGIGFAGKWVLDNTTMPDLAEFASNYYLHCPVLDRTGLKGGFDFHSEAEDWNSYEEDQAGSFVRLLQGIGLKLETGHGEVETLTIDHAELPTANCASLALWNLFAEPSTPTTRALPVGTQDCNIALPPHADGIAARIPSTCIGVGGVRRSATVQNAPNGVPLWIQSSRLTGGDDSLQNLPMTAMTGLEQGGARPDPACPRAERLGRGRPERCRRAPGNEAYLPGLPDAEAPDQPSLRAVDDVLGGKRRCSRLWPRPPQPCSQRPSSATSAAARTRTACSGFSIRPALTAGSGGTWRSAEIATR